MATGTVAPIRYEQYRWGDHVTGTKEQLQSLGLAMGRLFPGEVGGPKRTLTIQDPRGFGTDIKRERDSDRFVAWIRFPGRERLEEPVQGFATGVTLRQFLWCDEYRGAGDALVAAGLCRAEQFPGQPGMRKTCVTIFPDGTMATGAPTANHPQSREPGAKSIVRRGVNTFEVVVKIASEQAYLREVAWKQQEREWEARLDALPRPAPLTSLHANDAAQRRRAADYYIEHGVFPEWAPRPRTSHLRLVWSAPTTTPFHPPTL